MREKNNLKRRILATCLIFLIPQTLRPDETKQFLDNWNTGNKTTITASTGLAIAGIYTAFSALAAYSITRSGIPLFNVSSSSLSSPSQYRNQLTSLRDDFKRSRNLRQAQKSTMANPNTDSTSKVDQRNAMKERVKQRHKNYLCLWTPDFFLIAGFVSFFLGDLISKMQTGKGLKNLEKELANIQNTPASAMNCQEENKQHEVFLLLKKAQEIIKKNEESRMIAFSISSGLFGSAVIISAVNITLPYCNQLATPSPSNPGTIPKQFQQYFSKILGKYFFDKQSSLMGVLIKTLLALKIILGSAFSALTAYFSQLAGKNAKAAGGNIKKIEELMSSLGDTETDGLSCDLSLSNGSLNKSEG